MISIFFESVLLDQSLLRTFLGIAHYVKESLKISEDWLDIYSYTQFIIYEGFVMTSRIQSNIDISLML